MLREIILQILNRMPAAELASRHEEEQKDYILQDGRIVEVIQVPAYE